MLADDTYVGRRLWLLGEWDAALAVLGPDGDPELRAEIAVDRWFFQIERHEEAEKAVAALDPGSPTAHLLTGRLAYSRLLFQRDPRADDRAVAEASYRAAAERGDEKMRGWAEYHWGVLLDNIDQDAAGALPLYERALQVATKDGDAFFESYIIRHVAAHQEPAERMAMLRRCLHLRAALGARPQTIAAQALLAENLPEDDPAPRRARAGLPPGCRRAAHRLAPAQPIYVSAPASSKDLPSRARPSRAECARAEPRAIVQDALNLQGVLSKLTPPARGG